MQELWEGKGIFVNWWKAEPRMSVVPFGLKREWHDLFQPTLEAWSNTTLERTDIYGIRYASLIVYGGFVNNTEFRVYYRNAELIDHVDRHETHAVSAIINVEQKGMNSDWELEIYDVNGNIIHSDLQRGEAMLYERCVLAWVFNQWISLAPKRQVHAWKTERSGRRMVCQCVLPLPPRWQPRLVEGGVLSCTGRALTLERVLIDSLQILLSRMSLNKLLCNYNACRLCHCFAPPVLFVLLALLIVAVVLVFSFFPDFCICYSEAISVRR